MRLMNAKNRLILVLFMPENKFLVFTIFSASTPGVIEWKQIISYFKSLWQINPQFGIKVLNLKINSVSK